MNNAAATAAAAGLGAIAEEDEDEEDEAANNRAGSGGGGARTAEDIAMCVPQAFSHYSYVATDGQKLVCDLQVSAAAARHAARRVAVPQYCCSCLCGSAGAALSFHAGLCVYLGIDRYRDAVM